MSFLERLRSPIPIPYFLVLMWDQLQWLFNKAPTTPTRFWFGLSSLGLACFMAFSQTVHNPLSEYEMMMKLAPSWLWATGFFINGSALLYGVFSHKFNQLLVILEGLLGTIVWSTSAVAIVYTQQTLSDNVAGALIAFWLLVRYPTHWEHTDAN